MSLPTITIGVCTASFGNPTLEANLDAVAAHGLYDVQFDLGTAGLPVLPEHIDAVRCARIREALASRGITMAAIAGTFNMIDPDIQKRRDGLARLRPLAAACAGLGTSVITLCTGTRDPENMWRRHPDNDSPAAWHDLATSLADALRSADEHGVTLAFEPEVANVVDSAVKARRILDEMRSPYLKVVIDGANIFHAGELPRMREILDEAFALLGGDIVLAHAKDLDHDGEAGHQPAGHGLLDYDRYVTLLHDMGYSGPLIMHGLTDKEVDGCAAFLREKIAHSPYGAG
jgi:sugar phosphate isomerase/epimerase